MHRMRKTEATAAKPRVVAARGILLTHMSKAARACDAADLCDGIAVLGEPTLRVAAVTDDLSTSSVSRALKLTPEQRDAVRAGRRPLIMPPAKKPVPVTVPVTVPATVPTPPVTMVSAREKMASIVSEVGFDEALTLLATMPEAGMTMMTTTVAA